MVLCHTCKEKIDTKDLVQIPRFSNSKVTEYFYLHKKCRPKKIFKQTVLC